MTTTSNSFPGPPRLNHHMISVIKRTPIMYIKLFRVPHCLLTLDVLSKYTWVSAVYWNFYKPLELKWWFLSICYNHKHLCTYHAGLGSCSKKIMALPCFPNFWQSIAISGKLSPRVVGLCWSNVGKGTAVGKGAAWNCFLLPFPLHLSYLYHTVMG